jgi:hypothetical protein
LGVHRMPQATALSPGSLLGQGVITTSATPLMGYCNVYSAAGGPLSPTLRQAALGTLGTTCLVEKDPNDASDNAVTVTCYPGETFLDGSTTRTLTNSGDFLMLAILAIPGGVAQWKVVGSGSSAPAIGERGLTLDGGSADTVFDGDSITVDGGTASTTVYESLSFDGGGATTISGQGLYIASDGSLHYLGPTTDTVLAPA